LPQGKASTNTFDNGIAQRKCEYGEDDGNDCGVSDINGSRRSVAEILNIFWKQKVKNQREVGSKSGLSLPTSPLVEEEEIILR